MLVTDGYKPTRLDGPFLDIRLLKEVVPGVFSAFDKHGKYLFDLTQEGADRVSSADAFRIRVERLTR